MDSLLKQMHLKTANIEHGDGVCNCTLHNDI